MQAYYRLTEPVNQLTQASLAIMKRRGKSKVNEMKTKHEALEQISEIARAHGLTAVEIKTALAETEQGLEQSSGGLLGRILGYLGGTFIFAGLGVFIALNWDVMNSAARIIFTLGAGITTFIMAMIASSDERYTGTRIPLYLISAILQPVGLLVAIDEFSSGGDWHYAVLLTAGIMGFQQGVVFWKKRNTELLFTTLVFILWFFGTALDLVNVQEDLNALVLGTATVIFCIALEPTRYQRMTPFWYLAGSVLFFEGLFGLVQRTSFELVFLAVACAGVFLSAYVRSRTLLFVCTIAILAYISYFTAEHFQSSFGWPVLLIVLGLAFIALSAVAMRINNRYIN